MNTKEKKKPKRKFKPNTSAAKKEKIVEDPAVADNVSDKEKTYKEANEEKHHSNKNDFSSKNKKEKTPKKNFKKETKMVQMKGYYDSENVEKSARGWGGPDQSTIYQSRAPTIKKGTFKLPGKDELKVELEDTQKVLTNINDDKTYDNDQLLESDRDF